MLIMARNVTNVVIGPNISVVWGILAAVAAGIDFCQRELS